jgi:hypothetical protein
MIVVSQQSQPTDEQIAVPASSATCLVLTGSVSRSTRGGGNRKDETRVTQDVLSELQDGR